MNNRKLTQNKFIHLSVEPDLKLVVVDLRVDVKMLVLILHRNHKSNQRNKEMETISSNSTNFLKKKMIRLQIDNLVIRKNKKKYFISNKYIDAFFSLHSI